MLGFKLQIWCRKRLHYQLSHHHCPSAILVSITQHLCIYVGIKREMIIETIFRNQLERKKWVLKNNFLLVTIRWKKNSLPRRDFCIDDVGAAATFDPCQRKRNAAFSRTAINWNTFHCSVGAVVVAKWLEQWSWNPEVQSSNLPGARAFFSSSINGMVS